MPTNEEQQDYFSKLLIKLKKDPLFEQRQELGKFLIRHIDDLSPAERKRYDELLIILKP